MLQEDEEGWEYEEQAVEDEEEVHSNITNNRNIGTSHNGQQYAVAICI